MDLPTLPSQLPASVQENLRLAFDGGFAPATLRGLRSDIKRFASWCQHQGVSWLPADSRHVALFLEEMGRCGKKGAPYKPGSVDRFAASIRTMHHLAELPAPASIKMALVRKLHARKMGRAQQQATGLTLRQLEKILHQLECQIDSSKEETILLAKRDKALLLVGYCMLARGSEVLNLQWNDISHDGFGGTVATIRRSKVDQEGLGSEQHLWPQATRALTDWRKAHDEALRQRRQNEEQRYQTLVQHRTRPPIHPQGRKRLRPVTLPVRLVWQETPFVFRGLKPCASSDGESVLGWSNRLGLSSLNEMIQARAHAAGLVGHYSSHSLRIGAAQDLVAAGKALPAIMQDGRWKSPQMVLRYARKLLANRGAMAELGREHGHEVL